MDLRFQMNVFAFLGLCGFINNVQAIKTEYACFPPDGTPSTVKLQCPSGQRIRIREAIYGHNRWSMCYNTIDDCTQKTDTTVDECCGKTACQVQVKRSYITACSTFSTFLRIVFECVKLPPLVTFSCGPEADDIPPQPMAVVYRNTAVNMAQKSSHANPNALSAHDTTTATKFTSHTDAQFTNNNKKPTTTTSSSENRDASLLKSISQHRVTHTDFDDSTDNVVIWTCIVVGVVTAILVVILGYILWTRRRFSAASDPEKAVKESESEKPPPDNQPSVTPPTGQCNLGFVQDNEDESLGPKPVTRRDQIITSRQNMENEMKEESPVTDSQQCSLQNPATAKGRVDQKQVSSEATPARHVAHVYSQASRVAHAHDKDKQKTDVSELPIVQQLHKTAALVKQYKHTQINDSDENVVTRDAGSLSKTKTGQT